MLWLLVFGLFDEMAQTGAAVNRQQFTRAQPVLLQVFGVVAWARMTPGMHTYFEVHNIHAYIRVDNLGGCVICRRRQEQLV